MPKKKPDKPRCEASVHNDYGVGHHQCHNKGKYERDGKWYCGTHDPVRIKERDKKKRAYEEECREQRLKWQLERAREDAERGIIDACPFCGYKLPEDEDLPVGKNLQFDYYYVYCIKCEAQGPRITLDGNDSKERLQSKIKWNFRS